MKALFLAFALTLSFTFLACSQNNADKESQNKIEVTSTLEVDLEGLSKAYFASGCFWCVEAIFESVEGVEEVISGYAGGEKSNPTYEEVGAGLTDHAEAVEVYYNPKVITYKTLVKVYYGSHDPTTVNGQSPDFGKQYRSMILYSNDSEKKIATDYKKNLEKSGEYVKPIATEIVELQKFWPAEGYHQNYEKLHPNNGYVKNVSIPRLKKFQSKFPELLKENTH